MRSHRHGALQVITLPPTGLVACRQSARSIPGRITQSRRVIASDKAPISSAARGADQKVRHSPVISSSMSAASPAPTLPMALPSTMPSAGTTYRGSAQAEAGSTRSAA